MTNWQIWIDTGGTFTDGLARPPDGELLRVKVLSTGCLRAQLTEDLGHNTYRIHHPWLIRHAGLFVGYRLRMLNAAIAREWHITSMDATTNTFTLDAPFDAPLPTTIEITADEEAPVLATRLLTQTPLDQPFPPLQLRLGTTKGTNALLENQGCRVALLITDGFTDLPYIGTQQRPHLFDLHIPEPELFHVQTIAVHERLAADGTVLQPLTDTELHRCIDAIQPDIEAVAISLLHAYRNPVHEQQLAAALQQRGFAFTSVGHDLSPSIKLLTRTQTALVNAYLSPIIHQYVARIRAGLFGTAALQPGQFLVMSSAGSLQLATRFHPKDSLLSGPAGGVVAAAAIARQLGEPRVLTLDMGGTSTDAAHYNGRFDFTFTTRVGNADLLSPSLAIETVAAGGGSICGFDGEKLTVGPASAGASPGPACYGAGGPLTLTDVNLLLGKLVPAGISVPLSREAAQVALTQLQQRIRHQTGHDYTPDALLRGFEQIGDEKMAAAIRRISVQNGIDPRDYALLAFGGAGGLHACNIAERLGIHKVILPRDAGLLSALGMGQARIERLAEVQILQPLDAVAPQLPERITALHRQACAQLESEGFTAVVATPARVLLYLRFRGQDTPMEVRYVDGMDVGRHFLARYQQQFGYLPSRTLVEVESIKVFATTEALAAPPLVAPSPLPWQHAPQPLIWESLPEGFCAAGPAVVAGQQAAVYVPAGWTLCIWPQGHAVVERATAAATAATQDWGDVVELELFTNRFKAIADAMGTQLQRTAFSVNVKERLDFSCALLDARAQLLVNAPHIPVHLGSLGVCARLCLAALPIAPGDVVIVNHPKYGGSHLPDMTLLQGVFTPSGECIGYVINRAHHAEIGGKRPGSMPPDAQSLAEEGVVFAPQYLVRGGVAQWEAIEQQLTQAPYPTRALSENLADLRAALASLKTGEQALQALAAQHGLARVHRYMDLLQTSAHQMLTRQLQPYRGKSLTATEQLDDGHRIAVRIDYDGATLHFDFSSTSGVHPANFNANLSIVYSAILYVLRLLCADDVPLNEGLLRGVAVHLPPNTFLHPHFEDDPARCPAVVGGNTEVSQRLVDTLLKAWGVVAAGQGTMNNFLFGNAHFGYYETIGGGAGAGPGFPGRSGVHQHMTNTRITDPEDLERAYPVRLHRFALRPHTGGQGQWRGGDGLIREVEALVPLEVTLLTQNRINRPYGCAGGQPGTVGQQWLVRQDGTSVALPGVVSLALAAGERIRIATPGGGGWGREKM